MRAWRKLLLDQTTPAALPAFTPPPLPLLSRPALACGEAWRAQSRLVEWADAVGCVSAQLVCPYPPGIPLLIPGERLDRERLAWIEQQRRLWPNQIGRKVKVVLSA
jgi:arginine/lysine/ornithine decarboxylase